MSKIVLSDKSLADGVYTDNDGYYWAVTRLIEHSKGLDVFTIPVAGIYIGQNIFAESRTARALAEHVKRVNETSLEYPILLDPDGFIMDGWHRVVKAITEGHKEIKAVRFLKMPPHCGKEAE